MSLEGPDPDWKKTILVRHVPVPNIFNGKVKSKVLRYSLPSNQQRADPQMTLSHPPGGRRLLRVLTDRPALPQ